MGECSLDKIFTLRRGSVYRMRPGEWRCFLSVLELALPLTVVPKEESMTPHDDCIEKAVEYLTELDGGACEIVERKVHERTGLRTTVLMTPKHRYVIHYQVADGAHSQLLEGGEYCQVVYVDG